MKVLLIAANKEKIHMLPFPLGLVCVAEAATASGHEVRIVDYLFESDPEAALRTTVLEFKPDVVGIGIRNIDSQNFLHSKLLIDDAKAAVTICKELSGAPVVLGGAGYSIFPESALEYCGADTGIVGEGEVAFPRLLSKLEKGESPDDVPGIVLPKHQIKERAFDDNLDALPVPGYDLWAAMEEKKDIWLPIQSRRGCPLNCSYCSTESIEGARLRTRSPANVVRNLKRGVDAGFRSFYFADNTFNIPATYAKDLCREIINDELAIRWRCILYPWRVDDELVALMARAGCAVVSVGFESGCDAILKRMNKRYTRKDISEVNALLAAHGIERNGFLLLGGPGETKDTVRESMEFADSLNMESIKITIGIRIYPHTDLSKTALKEGLIASEDELLYPHFYIAKGMDVWLKEESARWVAAKPNWAL